MLALQCEIWSILVTFSYAFEKKINSPLYSPVPHPAVWRANSKELGASVDFGFFRVPGSNSLQIAREDCILPLLIACFIDAVVF